MKITKVSQNIDVITPGQTDINSLTPVELVEYTELENKLYYFERLKRKQRRKSKQRGLLSILFAII